MFTSAITTRTSKPIISIQLIHFFLSFVIWMSFLIVFFYFIKSSMRDTAYSDYCWLSKVSSPHLHRKSLFSGKPVQEETSRSPQQKERTAKRKEQARSP